MPRNPWISDLHWKREGQQPRSQKTQEALLDAAEALFHENGADATSVADVAKKAGVSVGALYHHFRDKKALLYALFDRMSIQYQDIGRAAIAPDRWDGASIRDILSGFIEFSLELGHVRPGFKRSGLEAAQDDPALREHFAEILRDIHQGLNQLLLDRKAEIGHPYPEMATGFVLDQITAMLRSRMDQTVQKSKITKCTDEAFAREAIAMASSYLQLIDQPENKEM